MVLLNTKNVQSESDIRGAYDMPCPARYHVAVNHAEEKANSDGTPGVQVEFQVVCDGLAPDNKTRTTGQSGKVASLLLSYVSEKGDDATKSCLDRVTRLALSCGIMKCGEEAEPDWNNAIGRELVIEIEPGKGTYKNKKTGEEIQRKDQVAYMGFWSLGNPEVANVPKDATTPGMQALGIALAINSGNGNASSSKPTTPATTATPKAKKSNFADLL